MAEDEDSDPLGRVSRPSLSDGGTVACGWYTADTESRGRQALAMASVKVLLVASGNAGRADEKSYR